MRHERLRHYNFAWLIPDSGDPRSDAIVQEAFEHEARVRGPDGEPAGYDGAPLFEHGQDDGWYLAIPPGAPLPYFVKR